MWQHGKPDLTRSGRSAFAALMGEVPNFEAIYRVPATHRLVVVRYRSRGGLERAEYWLHQKYDPAGRLVARYESFDELNTGGERRSGWSKFDHTGHLVHQSKAHFESRHEQSRS
jgi:hypothetical protein